MLNPSMKRTGIPHITLVICCCFALLLAACGQRGPLYLPEPEEQTGSDETISAAEDKDEKDVEENDEETPRT